MAKKPGRRMIVQSIKVYKLQKKSIVKKAKSGKFEEFYHDKIIIIYFIMSSIRDQNQKKGEKKCV